MKRIATLALTLLLLPCALCAAAETLTVSMVGDCTVGDQWKYHGYNSTLTHRVDEEGYDWCFSLAAEMFAADDLTVANCEGVLTDNKPPANHKFMTLGAESRYAEVFRQGYVDVCNIANNHGKDFGADSQKYTAASLEAAGVGAFGESLVWETEIKGVRIGLCGYTYPINQNKLRMYQERIDQLRADGCTMIIASAHWGREEHYNLTADQKNSGPALIDMGADVVFGHGSHTLQPIQIYKGKPIFYSLSNFVFGANGAPKDMDTAVVQAEFDIAEDGTVTLGMIRAIPYKMCLDRDFRPYPIEEEEGKLQVWNKLGKAKNGKLDTGLPESFLTTGVADFREPTMLVEDDE